MEEQSAKKMKLGIFVIIATTCLVVGLYFIGSKRSIFQSKIHVSAVFKNINGLMSGNNVQFNGINVGTVSEINAIADTAIKVEFTIDDNISKYITTQALASIGTDGLLGSKLVTIAPGKKGGQPLKDGDIINTLHAIETDKALRQLLVTNDNLTVISENMKTFSNTFNTPHSLWNLLSDTMAAANVKNALIKIRIAGDQTAMLTTDLGKILRDVKAGKGTLGVLLTDETLSQNLKKTMTNLKAVTDSFAMISGNLNIVSEKLKQGDGAIGMLLSDTTFAHKLNKSMDNIKDGSGNFNENMEALKVSWPFKKYFRNKKK